MERVLQVVALGPAGQALMEYFLSVADTNSWVGVRTLTPLRANQMAAKKTLDDMRLARDMYLQCVDEDPDYAPAWARLGRAYRFIEKFGEDNEGDLKRADEA